MSRLPIILLSTAVFSQSCLRANTNLSSKTIFEQGGANSADDKAGDPNAEKDKNQFADGSVLGPNNHSSPPVNLYPSGSPISVVRICSVDNFTANRLGYGFEPLDQPHRTTAYIVDRGDDKPPYKVTVDQGLAASIFTQLKTSSQIRIPAELNKANVTIYLFPQGNEQLIITRLQTEKVYRPADSSGFYFGAINRPDSRANHINVAKGSTNQSGQPNSQCDLQNSPLIISLQKQPILISSREKGVAFDLSGSGQKVLTSWPLTADSGFLAIDLDGDGAITSGKELFGNHSGWGDSSKRNFKNGFEALGYYDRNHDQRIDDLDAVYKDLLIWTDKNRDGVSQKDELSFLAKLNISVLFLSYVELNQVDEFANRLGEWGWAIREGQFHRMIDVWLNYRPMSSSAD